MLEGASYPRAFRDMLSDNCGRDDEDDADTMKDPVTESREFAKSAVRFGERMFCDRDTWLQVVF